MSVIHTQDGRPVDDTNPLPTSLPGSNNKIQLVNSGGFAATVSSSFPDAQTNANNSLLTTNMGFLFNGTTWDRWRSNTEGTLLASAARTASTTSPTQTNYNAKGVILCLRVNPASGTGGLQVSILTQFPAAGSSGALNVPPTAQTAAGTYFYILYPGVSGAQAATIIQATNAPLPRTWYAIVTHVDATSYTYQLDYQLIL